MTMVISLEKRDRKPWISEKREPWNSGGTNGLITDCTTITMAVTEDTVDSTALAATTGVLEVVWSRGRHSF
ncbi:hypothetical protein NL676_006319 [Syzygium grande]|nr:hypothetical protein NL676_006319 [Syzygium grande]